jgi:hypothetical protein
MPYQLSDKSEIEAKVRQSMREELEMVKSAPVL